MKQNVPEQKDKTMMVEELKAISRGEGEIRRGLSKRLLLLTILFVTVAEILIYIPALSYYRRSLLSERISAAHIAALILDTSANRNLTPEQEMRVLQGVGVKYLAFGSGGVRNILADGTINPATSKIDDLRDGSWNKVLRDALVDTIFDYSGNIRVIGDAPGLDFVEIIVDRRLLREDLVTFSRVFLGYSLFMSLVTAGVLYWALQRMIVRPVRRLASNVTRFAEHPEDFSRVMKPSGRGDEIGLTEIALAGMERRLAEELRKKRRLAELGLAVSKINHELRNILTTAQLLTDRLEEVDDSLVQRIAPRLVAVLDRAISFCESTLAYGRAQEREPKRELFPVNELFDHVEEAAGLKPDTTIMIRKEIEENILIDADKEHMIRAIANLVRNSAQALETLPDTNREKIIRLSASQMADNTIITVYDNGPGIPKVIRDKLFKPFQTNKTGKGSGIQGTGLGLVIALELVEAHGGQLLLDEGPSGACFRIIIPKRRLHNEI